MAKIDAKAVNALQIRTREIDDPVISKTCDELIRLTSTLQSLGASLAESPANNGRYVSADLAIGSNTVKHDLGRQGVGAFPCTQSAASSLAVTAIDATNVTISASVACTVKLWVF